MNTNSYHLAHDAVARKLSGEDITPATITAELIEGGCTPAQARSQTKIIAALIPTVTQSSLNAWVKTQVA